MDYILIGGKSLTKQMIKEHSDGNILADGIIRVNNLSDTKDIFSHEVYKIDVESNIDYLSITNAIKKIIDSSCLFKIKCFIHGSNSFNKNSIGYNSRDIEVNAGKILENAGFKVNLENPSVTIIVNVINNKSYITKISGNYLVHEKNYINRAGFKLIEAFDYFKIDVEGLHIKKALDIGAAPGGFSYEMAKKGIFVDAIDPGLLDSKLIDVHINHIKKRIEDFSTNTIYDIITNDMNVFPLESAKIILKLKENLRTRGIVIMTIKCINKKSYSYYMKQALMELKDSFEGFEFKHLPHNRAELTMLCIKK
ncbi:MAG: THUMP domain-containing protein [Candidatus Marsarchaeota archaeon]|nr:THUMP domain-containing protein [Candidatus Marsarchaeota archaeon]